MRGGWPTGKDLELWQRALAEGEPGADTFQQNSAQSHRIIQTQEAVETGLAEVTVHQDHLRPVLGQRHGQVC
jgi:hypothetical protein